MTRRVRAASLAFRRGQGVDYKDEALQGRAWLPPPPPAPEGCQPRREACRGGRTLLAGACSQLRLQGRRLRAQRGPPPPTRAAPGPSALWLFRAPPGAARVEPLPGIPPVPLELITCCRTLFWKPREGLPRPPAPPARRGAPPCGLAPGRGRCVRARLRPLTSRSLSSTRTRARLPTAPAAGAGARPSPRPARAAEPAAGAAPRRRVAAPPRLAPKTEASLVARALAAALADLRGQLPDGYLQSRAQSRLADCLPPVAAAVAAIVGWAAASPPLALSPRP
jgi:hypothetical protein